MTFTKEQLRDKANATRLRNLRQKKKTTTLSDREKAELSKLESSENSSKSDGKRATALPLCP